MAAVLTVWNAATIANAPYVCHHYKMCESLGWDSFDQTSVAADVSRMLDYSLTRELARSNCRRPWYSEKRLLLRGPFTTPEAPKFDPLLAATTAISA